MISKLFVHLATGGNETSFCNLCLRTAVSQARGREVRPNLFEAILRNGSDCKPIYLCRRNSLSGFHFGSNSR